MMTVLLWWLWACNSNIGNIGNIGDNDKNHQQNGVHCGMIMIMKYDHVIVILVKIGDNRKAHHESGFDYYYYYKYIK